MTIKEIPGLDQDDIEHEDIDTSRPLDDKQKHILERFRQAIKEAGSTYKGSFPEDTTLVRFLRARNFNEERAKAMFDATVAWREETGVDTIREDFEFQERDEVKQYYAQFHHKTDKEGRPIYVEQLGKLDVDKLMEVTTMERLLKYHVREWEVLTDLKFPACSKQACRPISTSLTIIDVKGVNMRMFSKRVRQFVKEVTQLDQDHYPEFLGTMYIINAPFVFKAIWQVIKVWLDKKTQKKIQVLGGHYQKQLLELVDAEDLPSFLGGTCSCDGGCENSDAGPWHDPAFQLDPSCDSSTISNTPVSSP
eukprot:jgi/Mesen1/2605/ME000166S01729